MYETHTWHVQVHNACMRASAVVYNFFPELREAKKYRKKQHKEDRQKIREEFSKVMGKEWQDNADWLMNETETRARELEEEQDKDVDEDLKMEIEQAKARGDLDEEPIPASSAWSTRTDVPSYESSSCLEPSDDQPKSSSATHISTSVSYPTSEYRPSE